MIFSTYEKQYRYFTKALTSHCFLLDHYLICLSYPSLPSLFFLSNFCTLQLYMKTLLSFLSHLPSSVLPFDCSPTLTESHLFISYLSFFLFLLILWHLPLLSRSLVCDHITAVANPVFAGFIAPLPDNSPVLTGWSYYPLYEMSMLRALYEILVPMDKMMELVSAVIPQPYNGISWEIHNAMDYW